MAKGGTTTGPAPGAAVGTGALVGADKVGASAVGAAVAAVVGAAAVYSAAGAAAVGAAAGASAPPPHASTNTSPIIDVDSNHLNGLTVYLLLAASLHQGIRAQLIPCGHHIKNFSNGVIPVAVV